MRQPYSDKKLCSFLPSVVFFTSVMPTRKNQHWGGAENIIVVATNVTSIVEKRLPLKQECLR